MRASVFTLVAALALTLAVPSCGGDGSGGDDPAPVATGEMGAWRMEPALPIPVSGACTTVARDWLIVIGGSRKPPGSDTFVRSDTVYGAEIGDDGALGPWQELGNVPSAVIGCMLATDGERLFLVGGTFDDEVDQDQVWSASFGADGALGAWTSMGALPTGDSALLIGGSEVWIDDGVLITNGSTLPQESDMTFTARVDVSGDSLGTWQVDYWLDGFRYQGQHAKVGNFLYDMGGYGNVDSTNVVYTESHVAVIDDSGAVVDSFDTTDIPAETTFGEAVAVDEFVFLIGGRSGIAGGGETASVYVAAVQSDGQLGAWTAVESLPMAMSSHDVSVGPTRIYVVGGAADSMQFDTVYSAQVRYYPDEAL